MDVYVYVCVCVCVRVCVCVCVCERERERERETERHHPTAVTLKMELLVGGCPMRETGPSSTLNWIGRHWVGLRGTRILRRSGSTNTGIETLQGEQAHVGAK